MIRNSIAKEIARELRSGNKMKKNKVSPLKMKAFLKAEGWILAWDSSYWMPKNKNQTWPLSLLESYRIALRRKSSRERAALKRAGYLFNHGSWWKARKKNPDYYDQFTRSEALSKLEGGGGGPMRWIRFDGPGSWRSKQGLPPNLRGDRLYHLPLAEGTGRLPTRIDPPVERISE